jgi:hypothetical protein
MSFLSPLFLIGIAAAAVPVLLHLLRRRPEMSVKFPAVRMLRHSPVEQSSRRRLRELLLLALRVSALVLLSVAFARPFFASATVISDGGVTIVALDTSLSVSAPGRMAAAQDVARQAVDTAPSGDLVGVVTFADAAAVAAAPSGDRGLAMSAVNDAAARAGATRYRTALEAAAELIARHGNGSGRIVVVTDLQAAGWMPGDRVRLPPQVAVHVADIGPLPENLAVVRTRAEGDGRVIATIANFGSEAREARATLTSEEGAAGKAQVTIGGGQSADVTFTGVAGESATVTIDDPAGLQLDNIRHLVLQRSVAPAVLIVTATGDLGREAFYAQQALTAGGPRGADFEVEGVAAPALSTWDADRLDRFAAVIVVSTRGLDARGREVLTGFVARGGGMLLAAGPDVDGDVAAEALSASVAIGVSEAPDSSERARGRAIVATDARHPLFSAMGAAGEGLGVATFQRVADVQSEECAPIARFTTGEPALLDCSGDAGRTLILASDLNQSWNTLPRHAAFVPFLHESVRYLASRRGAPQDLLVNERPDAQEPGLVQIALPGGTSRLVAVNPDPTESAPARLSPEAFLEPVSAAPAGPSRANPEARQQEARQGLWRYALLAMIVMLIAESAIASRDA